MKLSFRLGSIPVRVHQTFFFVVLALGYTANLVEWAQWGVVAFVGVLLHELGHALVGRAFGLTPQIDLIGFGGLTSWSAGDARALGPGKRIAISLAGPGVGLVIGLTTWVAIRVNAGLPPLALFDGQTPFTSLTSDVVWVNAGWAAMNLLPILPMDGGAVLFQTMNAATHGRGEKPARIVSLTVAGAIAILALVFSQIYVAILAGLFAMQNVQALRAVLASERGAGGENTPGAPPRF
jgi:Zn-dependent protease